MKTVLWKHGIAMMDQCPSSSSMQHTYQHKPLKILYRASCVIRRILIAAKANRLGRSKLFIYPPVPPVPPPMVAGAASLFGGGCLVEGAPIKKFQIKAVNLERALYGGI
jgi:hypothetical protein